MLLKHLHMLVRALDWVTAATVINCFRHCGISEANEGPGTEAACKPGQHRDILRELDDALEEASFGYYVNVDSSAMVWNALTDKDIFVQITGQEPVAMKVTEEEVLMRLSASQVMEAIGVVCVFQLRGRRRSCSVTFMLWKTVMTTALKPKIDYRLFSSINIDSFKCSLATRSQFWSFLNDR